MNKVRCIAAKKCKDMKCKHRRSHKVKVEEHLDDGRTKKCSSWMECLLLLLETEFGPSQNVHCEKVKEEK